MKSRTKLIVGSVAAVLVAAAITTKSPPKQPAAALPPSPAGHRLLAFSDDFNGTELDSDKWSVCFPGNVCTHDENKELQVYTAGNVSVANGSLKLTAKREARSGKAYTSGLIQSAAKYQFTYGYMEARAKTPAGIGLWSTIWNLPVDGSWPPELDMLEQVGGVKDTNFVSVHYGPDGQNDYVQQTTGGPDLTADFHIYGMDWQPDKVTFYLDNKEVASYKNRYNVPNKPMYILLNLAVGGTATPPPTDATFMPASLEVDYLKVWR